MVYILLGTGFEEAEALVPAELLRRAGIETALVGVDGMTVTGGHGIQVAADLSLADVDLERAKMLLLPGGLGGVEVIDQAGEAVLRGRVMAHLLCINALEEIDCYDKVCEYTLPRRYPRPAADVIAQCYPSVGSVSARKVGDDTSAAIVLTVRGIVSFRSTQTVLADVQCTSPLVRDDGDIALRIYFAQAGEDMFDIAKRYAASPEAIAAANDTGSGILEAPQRLLIPSAT